MSAVDAGHLDEEQARLTRLRALVKRRYKYIDRKWDLVFWITAAFIVGAAADITKLLFAARPCSTSSGWRGGSPPG